MAAGPVGTVWATGSWTDTCWTENVWAALGAALDFVLDLNTRIAVFVRDRYSQPTGDLTTLATRYLTTEAVGGDANAKFLRMIQDATDAMD